MSCSWLNVLLFYASLTVYTLVVLYAIIVSGKYDFLGYVALVMVAMWLSIMYGGLCVEIVFPLEVSLQA